MTRILCFFTAVFRARKKVAVIGFSVVVALIGGCASMSEKQCLTANWQDKGFRDGRNGEPLSRFEDHREACQKAGVSPDRTLYFEGRDKGVQHYCTPENGFQEGRKGRQYRNACPADLEYDFLNAHELGKKIYGIEEYIEKLNRESRQLEDSLSDETDKEKAIGMRQELRKIDHQLKRARDEMRFWEKRANDR